MELVNVCPPMTALEAILIDLISREHNGQISIKSVDWIESPLLLEIYSNEGNTELVLKTVRGETNED